MIFPIISLNFDLKHRKENSMNYTTIEQSKKLVELGLNPDTADMCWGIDFESNRYNCSPYPLPWKDYTCNEVYLSCWSLGALLEVVKTRKDCNFITIHSSDSLKWSLNTSYYELVNWKEKETLEDTLIEAAYNMVCWLLENGYIQKGE